MSSNGKTWHCHWTGIGLRLGKISGGLLTTELELKLTHDSGMSPRQIQSLWRQIEQEEDFQQDCAVSLQDPLANLLKIRVERLDPHRLFNPSLASMTKVSYWLPL